MKNIFILLLILPLYMAAQTPDPDFTDKMAANKIKQFNKLKEYATKSSNGANYDVKYARYFWSVDPAIRYIQGAVTTYFDPVGTNVSEITFDMVSVLTTDSVIYHSSGISFSHQNDVLTISLPAPINSGVIDSITIYYKGEPSENGFGSFTQDFHGIDSIPIIWTLSEPYGAHDWMPCKESLTDKIDSIDVFIQTKPEYKAGSNGVLIKDTIIGNDRFIHWKHRHPIATYLVAFSVTNYASYSDTVHLDGGETFEILNYVYPESLSYAQSLTPHTSDIFNLYHQFITEYPYKDEKYGHAQCGFNGGMEHQTMTFLGDFGHELIAHELAHQWFGDFITCGSWKDLWLNEGFATYFHGWTYEHMSPYLYWPSWKEIQINKVTQYPGGSVYCYDTADVSLLFSSRLRYAKGAMLLHMLRWEIGDSAFFAGINNYLTNSNFMNGTALTEDIISIFETSSNTTLSEFFNDWCYNEGYPVYNISWWQEANLNLNIIINQTQSHNSVDFFEMHLPLRAVGINDSLMLRVHNTENAQHFIFPMNFQVNELKFDPDYRIVTRNTIVTNISDEEISISDLNIYPNPVSDILYLNIIGTDIRKIQLFDISGKEISFNNQAQQLIDGKINVSSIASGIYFLKAISENKTYWRKFIKE